MPPPRPYLKNLPNFLTIMRMVAIPVIVVIMLFIWPDYPASRLDQELIASSGWWKNVLETVNPGAERNELFSFLAGIIFVMASMTDLLDGYLARKWDVVSNLGKMLDPLADKLIVMSAMIMLIPLGRLPAWMVIVVMSREVSITALRGIAGAEGKVIEASALGKYKTIFQIIAISGLLLHYDDPFWEASFHNMGAVMFLVALFFTIWSGIDYFYRYWTAATSKE